jgi:ribosome-associated protein
MMSSTQLARSVAKMIVNKKGNDVVVLDLRKISSMVDYFIIVTASGDIHARAIADDIGKRLRNKGVKKWHMEGYSFGHWILLDYVDVVVHIFLEEERLYYNIESLWGDAPSERIEDRNES